MTPPGLLLRIERYPQIDPQAAVFEFDLRLPAETMADFALDQGQAEAMPRRLADRRAAALDPVQHETVCAAPFDRPRDLERSPGHALRTRFGGIRSKLVDDHAEREREFGLERNHWPVDDDAIIATGPIGLDLPAHHIDERNVSPRLARDQLVGPRHSVQPIEEGVAGCFHIVRIL